MKTSTTDTPASEFVHVVIGTTGAGKTQYIKGRIGKSPVVAVVTPESIKSEAWITSLRDKFPGSIHAEHASLPYWGRAEHIYLRDTTAQRLPASQLVALAERCAENRTHLWLELNYLTPETVDALKPLAERGALEWIMFRQQDSEYETLLELAKASAKGRDFDKAGLIKALGQLKSGRVRDFQDYKKGTLRFAATAVVISSHGIKKIDGELWPAFNMKTGKLQGGVLSKLADIFRDERRHPNAERIGMHRDILRMQAENDQLRGEIDALKAKGKHEAGRHG